MAKQIYEASSEAITNKQILLDLQQQLTSSEQKVEELRIKLVDAQKQIKQLKNDKVMGEQMAQQLRQKFDKEMADQTVELQAVKLRRDQSQQELINVKTDMTT